MPAIGYFWNWMNCIARLDVLVLALMLVYVVVSSARASYLCRLARRLGEADTTRGCHQKLICHLIVQAALLKSVAFIAPYVGLAGACFGMLGAFLGAGMEKHTYELLVMSTLAASLLTTIAGVLVAIPANCAHNHLNYLRTRIGVLAGRMPGLSPAARRFPLAKRFSGFPAFALIAAPGISIVVAACMTITSFHVPFGFALELASAPCVNEGGERLIVLHVSGGRKPLHQL